MTNTYPQENQQPTALIMVWHYTVLQHAKKIIKDGSLKVSDADGFKPALWFSTNQNFEETSLKLVMQYGNIRTLSFNEQHTLLGCLRFGVEFEATMINWYKFKHKGKVDPNIWEKMTAAGIENGANPKEWYASFVNFPRRKWKKIQQYDGSQWIDVDMDKLINDTTDADQ